MASSEYCINFIMYVLTVFEPNKVGIEKERMPVPITKNFLEPFLKEHSYCQTAPTDL